MDVIPQPPNPWDIDPDDFSRDGSDADRLRFLVRYALLAPSTRNTQPWRFRVNADGVELHLDLSRWQRIADADQRDMLAQVCAGQVVERLYLAATLRGLALQPVSQILEAVDTRDEVGALVGHAVVPIQPFRLGHASSSRTHTPRRPLDEVLL